MKLKYIIILLSAFCFCCTPEDGAIGPAGSKGATGKAGTDNNVTGAPGVKGPAGDKGATGDKGTPGKDAAAAGNNLVNSAWTVTTWKYRNKNSDNEAVFTSEIDIKELTEDLINKGLITIFIRINSGTTGFFEFNQGILYTVQNRRIELNGYSAGKILLMHRSNSSETNEAVASALNSYKIEVKISGLKTN